MSPNRDLGLSPSELAQKQGNALVLGNGGEDASRRIPEAICAYSGCGHSYTQTRKWGLYCSAACRTKAWDLAHPRVLACGPKRKRDLDAQFKAWLVTPDGQTVYLEFVRRALSLRDAGWKHYSADALVHAVRFDRSVKVGPDADGYRINDHFVARLARLAMANVPELANPPFFELRKLRLPNE